MKKITFILSLLLISLCYCCESSDDTTPPVPTPEPEPPTDTVTTPDNGGISPDAVLSYGVENLKMRSESGFARFATLYAWHMRMNEGYEKSISTSDSASYWERRDTVENKFRFRGWDVIREDSTLGSLILAHDVLLCAAKDTAGSYINMLTIFTEYPNLTFDTIAYIPNQKMRDNLKIVQEYYDNKEFDGVYQMFDTAYNFIPITGADWLKLKAEGKE